MFNLNILPHKFISKSKKIIWFIILASFLSSVYWLSKVINYTYLIWPNIEKNCKEIHNTALHEIDAKLSSIQKIVKDLSQELASGKINKTNINNQLKLIAKDNPDIFSIGVAYAPDATQDNKLFAPYFVNSNNNQEVKQIEQEYNYLQSDWYKELLNSNGKWLKPYYDKISKALLAQYGEPFYINTQTNNKEKKSTLNNSKAGIVFVNYNLKSIHDLVSSLPLGQSGYGFILSDQGTFISHPIESYISKQTNITELAQRKRKSAITTIALESLAQDNGDKGDNGNKGNNGTTWKYDAKIGKNVYAIFSKLDNVDWHFTTIFIQDDLTSDFKPIVKSSLMRLIVSLVVFFIFLSMVLSGVFYSDSKFKLWLNSAVISLILALGIGFIWALQLHDIPNGRKYRNEIILLDKAALSQVLDKIALNGAKLNQIPTGINLRHLLIEQTYIESAGYIWQKNNNIDKNLDGTFFPSALKTKQDLIYETLSQNKENSYDLKSWNFVVKALNRFDFSRYPFDSQHIKLQIKQKVKDNNDLVNNSQALNKINKNSINNNLLEPQDKQQAVLVPDFEAYPFLNPNLLPGILPNLSLASWKLERSYFSYSFNSRGNLSKFSSYIGEENVPQLNFNVIVTRNFFDPFITYIVPILLACLFLFVVLIAETKFEIWDPITIMSGLFFGVLLAHLDLRRKFSSNTIVYLEYFFIIVYLIMLLVVLTILLISKDYKSKIIQYQKAIIPKTLYWPVLLSLWFIITVIFFR